MGQVKLNIRIYKLNKQNALIINNLYDLLERGKLSRAKLVYLVLLVLIDSKRLMVLPEAFATECTLYAVYKGNSE
jgi:hypothetical protein